jgi:agmatinase
MKDLTFLSPAAGFLGLPAKEAKKPKDADAIVIPFGLEDSVSYGGGTKLGPRAIIKASQQVELFDEELWCQPHEKFGVATVKPFPIKKKMVDALAQIEGVVESVLKAGKFPLVLGGEHSVTAGAIRPFARRYDKITLLHFDAHADLRDGYGGEKYSHAAAIRRCLDHDNVRTVSLGIRNISQSEIPFYEANKDRVKIFWAKDKADWKIKDILKALGDDPVYLTFDIDGFDGSVMPATGTPEPGGIFWQETVAIIRAAMKHCNVVGADVVELAPKKELHACDFLAAKLCFKILGYKFAG